MEISCTDEKWSQLIQLVDNGIRKIAQSANVSHEDLRYRYVMRCLHITKPLECSTNDLTIKQRNEKSGSQQGNCQNVANISTKAQTKRQQRENFGFSRSNSDKSDTHQNYQQNFPTRNVRHSNAPPCSLPATINSVNQMFSCEMNDSKFEDRNISISELLDSNKKKVAKFYCDIEAALAGELSDVEDSEEQTFLRDIKFKKLSNDDGMLRTSESLVKETISLVQEQLRKNKQLETRVVRYPNAKPLALNIIHKVYVIQLEGAHAWVRLYDGKRPPCFDASHVVLNAMKSLEWMELFPGTPCVVLTRLNPLDIVNDGIARELIEFESYARAVIEECNETTETVTVRLVDFGFRLTELDVAAIKPLTIAFDGPPLAFRLQIDLLPKQQKESLCRYVTLSVRLTATREKQFLCWRKTWKAIDIKKQNWNNEKSDRSSSTKSFEMNDLNDQHCASSCFGLVTRVFVSSWLNKEHKSAGGRGIEAALCGITKRHSDLPPCEFAVGKADNLAKKEMIRSTDNCLNELMANRIMVSFILINISYHIKNRRREGRKEDRKETLAEQQVLYSGIPEIVFHPMTN